MIITNDNDYINSTDIIIYIYFYSNIINKQKHIKR